MSSVVEICNKALASVRGRSINSLTEASKEAQQCKLHYEAARDFVLRDTPWQFAKKTAILALREEEPLQWTYAYQYPSDCLHVRMVTGAWGFKNQTSEDLAVRSRYIDEYIEPDPSVPFALENISGDKVIVADEPEAYVIYTKKITDPNLFDPAMEEALVNYLASKIAIPVVGGEFGRQMKADALQLYTNTLAANVTNDQNEQRRPRRRQPRLVNARR